jgi:DhnA family fructose-bisphosphate aldolase class Ia
METGKALRLRRLFSRGRSVIVPIDHALFSEPDGPIEDLRPLVETIAATSADGILITPAMLRYVRDVIGQLATVVRIDGTHTRLGSHLERIDLVTDVEHAVSMGADTVVINVFVGTENEDELLRKLGLVATECCQWGVPLVAEMIPRYVLNFHYAKEKRTFDADRAATEICLVSRLGAELGADVIKTHYTGDQDSFRRVVRATPVPIVMAGGPKAGSDAEFLRMIQEAVAAGAGGVCIGRNVWQRDNLKGMLEALCRLVHEGAAAEAVESLVEGAAGT